VRVRTAVLGAAAVLLASRPAAGEPGKPATAGAAIRDKKDLRLESKETARAAADPAARAEARRRLHRQLDQRVGKPPEPLINVYNTWTREYVAFDARAGAGGAAIPDEHAADFLRCHFTSDLTDDFDPRLFGVLARAARHFKVSRVNIISGFRSPKYNLMLRKKGRGVARNSQHTQGKAVDFRLPGISSQRLLSWARGLRLGGVGFYPSSGFVHVDTGPVRYWGGQ
jgi:hypothetical protein